MVSFEALRLPHFRRLWIGQAVSQFGDAMYFLVFLFMVDRITQNPTLVGAVAAVQALPYLILSPLAGALADRMDRRFLMVVSDFGSAVVLMGFAGMIVATQTPPVWSIFFVATALATLNVFFAPAKGAAIPRIVPPEHLQAANSLSSATQHFMPLIGLGLSASVLGALEKANPTHFFLIAVLVNGLSFVYSGWCLTRLPQIAADRSAGDHQHPIKDALDGIRFVRQSPVILTVVAVTMLFGFFIAPFMVVYLAVNRVWFGGNYWTLASFEASFVGAMVIMSLLMTKLTIHRVGVAFVVGSVVCGLFVAAMGFSPFFWPFLVLNLLCGFALPLFQLPLQTYIQRTVPDEFMGRVQSVLSMAGTVVMPIGTLVTGHALNFVSPTVVFVVMGVGMGVAALLGLLVKEFRECVLPPATSVETVEAPIIGESLLPAHESSKVI